MTRPNRPNVCVAFQNAQETSCVLASRDFRFVLIAIAVVVASAPAAPHACAWLLKLLQGGAV